MKLSELIRNDLYLLNEDILLEAIDINMNIVDLTSTLYQRINDAINILIMNDIPQVDKLKNQFSKFQQNINDAINKINELTQNEHQHNIKTLVNNALIKIKEKWKLIEDSVIKDITIKEEQFNFDFELRKILKQLNKLKDI